MMGRLVAIGSGEVQQRIQISESGSMCLTQDTLWLATSSMEDFGGDENDDDYDDEIRTDLHNLDPDTLSLRRSTPLRGQVFDLAGDENWLWASVFSRADQVDRLLRINLATGVVDRPIEFDSIDVSKFNPIEETEILLPDKFAEVLVGLLDKENAQFQSGAAIVAESDGQWISVTVATKDLASTWSCQFSFADIQGTAKVAARVSETLLATYRAQWDPSLMAS
jgi:hypothetical protein